MVVSIKMALSYSLLKHGVSVQAPHTNRDHCCWNQLFQTPQWH